MITLTINGQQQTVSDGLSVADLVQTFTEISQGVAVAVNAKLVPKSCWADAFVSADDEIEILTAAPGG